MTKFPTEHIANLHEAKSTGFEFSDFINDGYTLVPTDNDGIGRLSYASELDALELTNYSGVPPTNADSSL